MTKIPETNNLLQKSRLPLGVLIHPFRDLNVSNMYIIVPYMNLSLLFFIYHCLLVNNLQFKFNFSALACHTVFYNC